MPEAVKTTTTIKDKSTNYLKGLERQLNELWSQYVKHLDESGFDETAKSLKERYFNVYRCYRHNKEWRELMGN